MQVRLTQQTPVIKRGLAEHARLCKCIEVSDLK